MKITIALSVVSVLSGCGTINTVFRDDAWTSQRLADNRSTCDAIPRLYSGVAIGFCSLVGGPHKARDPGFQSYGLVDAHSVLIDMGLSGITDTLVLPYTIYAQGTKGSIPKSRLD
jgi:uncharacterized protein YceK